jgi:hypothetical protein
MLPMDMVLSKMSWWSAMLPSAGQLPVGHVAALGALLHIVITAM